MELIRFCFLLISFSAVAIAVPEANCFSVGSESITFNHRDTFTISLTNGGELGSKKYACTCNGYTNSCARLDCRLEEPEEPIIVVPMPTGNEEEEEEPQSIFIGGSCYDETTKQYYERGQTFIRKGTPSMGCKCPESGSLVIKCVTMSCQLAPTPNPPLPDDINMFDCFDPWMNSVVDHGSFYNRSRRMSEFDTESGVYSCSCSRGRVRCTAIDIPCCDELSGEYRGKGEDVTVSIQGTLMGCTCFGGRSSFRNCQYYRKRTTTIPTTARILPTTASTTATCTDRYSGRRYRVGTFFIQKRPSSGTYRCECVQRFHPSGGSFMQTRCRRRV